ncbi:T9SS type B sorting domain-containing protein [Saccharicrinis carchari]|nr:gliding motility-associated C-terminal domain-containing protein [Saccharicrinis carchari]
MKPLIYFFFITCFFLPNYVLGQEKPTATIKSEDIAYCITNKQNVTIRVEFDKGEPPYSFEYKINENYYYHDGGGNINNNWFEWTISPSETSNITLLEVFDQNYPATEPTEPDGDLSPYRGGSDLIYGSMEVRVDTMPVVNAGPDDDICGYTYTLAGEVTGRTDKIWWSYPNTDGTFNDSTSLAAVFTGSESDDYLIALNANNGECYAYDEIEIELKGRPTGELTETDPYEFCSTDGTAHTLPVEVNLTGVSDFTYTLKDTEGNITQSFNALNENDTQLIPVSQSGTFTLNSIEDGQGCFAEAKDMQGSRMAIDVKPIVFAGDDVTSNCGPTYQLAAYKSDITTGKWTSSTSAITFTDDTKHNSLATATFNASDIYKDATLRWTETTTDELKCASYDEINIRYVKLPSLTQKSVSNDIICENKSTTLSFDITGNFPCTLHYNLDGASLSKIFNSTEEQLTIAGTDLEIGDNNLNITNITDDYGCNSPLNLSQKIVVDQMPLANAGPDTVVCGKMVNLEAVPSLGISGWMPAKGLFSEADDPHASFTANNTGTLHLVWKETNGACSDTDTVQVVFFDAPFPVKDTNDTLLIYAAKSVELPAWPLEVGIGQWSIIEPNVSGASISNPTLHNASLSNLTNQQVYKLQWKAVLEAAPENCREKTYEVIVDSRPMLAPTGISPDGDGINDELKILGAKENSQLAVFNKQGKLVFKTNAFHNAFNWKGTDQNGSTLPRGTYYYVYQDDERTVKNYLIIRY